MKAPWSVKQIALFATVVLVAGIALLGVAKWREVKRALFVARICTGAEQVENFRSMDQIFPSRIIRQSCFRENARTPTR